MRICIVYDCLFPYTVGGAERWCRNLAERLAAAGHHVTYLTLRQWTGEETSRHPPGVNVVAVGPRMALYGHRGQRRILPPIVFGLGVFWRLAFGRERFDVVHTASFPYFSLLAAGLLRPLKRYRLVVDWHEIWSRKYWLGYAGPFAGRFGWAVQQLCVRFRQQAFCFAHLTAARLTAARLNGELQILEGEYAGPIEGQPPRPVEAPVVLFIGRQIPEKRPRAAVAAIAAARAQVPELTGLICGSGPEHAAVVAEIERLGLAGIVEAPGFVASDRVERALRGALCLLAPSSREGYGLVVVEAAAASTPVILAGGEDNAAVELVESGVNGLVTASGSPEDLAEAIVTVARAGLAMRRSTAEWFARNARRLSLEESLKAVVAAYGEVPAA
jgi:glycosyltransferase involved in cell wall biosynthesis